MKRVVERLIATLQPGRRNAELARELEAHRALLEDEFARRGLDAAAARAAARRTLGSTALTTDWHRDARSFVWLDDLVRDLRFAVRMLKRSPGFAALAVVTLAVGIGATTGIFTLMNDVLLRSLPVRDPGGLVVLGDTRGAGTAVGRQNGSFTLFSVDLYHRLATERVFDSLCAVQSTKSRVTVRRDGTFDDEPANARLVSTNYFEVLGTTMALGRPLAPADDAASAPPVAVVSYRYWDDRLNHDPSAVGSTVRIGRTTLTIVGVAAPGFFGETLESDPPSFWMPLAVERRIDPARSLIDVPDVHWLYLIGRLAPGVTTAQAQSRITAALQEWLFAREGSAASVETRAKIAATRVELTPGAGGVTHARRMYGSALQLLLAIASVVLLIACANIANLLLARGAAREVETSIRRAIGASRGRLVRQSLAESLLLALLGGMLGVLVAWWGVHALLALAFGDTRDLPFSTSPDCRVLAFTCLASSVAAFACGLLPAIRGTAAISTRHTRRLGWSSALVVVQVALSLVVLAAAAALARSLANLATQTFGFESEHVLVVDVDPARAGYTVDRLGPLYREISSRLNALPGVTSAAFSYYSPFDDCCWAFTIAVPGHVPRRDESRSAMLNRVSPQYFETIGTRVVRGRAIDASDTPAAPMVAVVNEAFVRRFVADRDPIGARFSIGDGGLPGAIEIVGVAADAKYDSPRDGAAPMAFLPLLQRRPDEDADATTAHFIRTIEVRSAGDAAAIAGPVRTTLAAIDPNLPVLRMATLSDQVARALNGEQVIAALAAAFGAVALALTCVGLYGVTAYTVERRTREIGIRMALGADRAAVTLMVVREVLARGAIGTLIGVPAAFAAMRVIQSALYGVGPADVADSSLAACVLLASLLLAGYAPARRASRIEPIEALRRE